MKGEYKTWVFELSYFNFQASCPGCKTFGGVSNISFSFRSQDHIRDVINSVFLFHAIKVGLDMGIVNASQIPLKEIEKWLSPFLAYDVDPQ
jgi:5-methyltetrahydrofolate--homocysteine methyltransferase